ncbi:MAG: aspartate/glutamate racemase family protein [Kiloniellales bacterium]|nr:aspartate/glutamate racemase family protein [Kiloniellales bacterium]
MSFRLGVVQLNTRFPRLPGDIGNPQSFPFPVVYRRVEAATVAAVVREGAADEAAARALIGAAHALVESDGVSLIATSCGFLGALQRRLEQAVSVPVIASAFALLPFLRQVYGEAATIGVLTFDARRLSAAHFGPWSDAGTLVEGIEGGELHRVIAGDLPALDREAAEDEVCAAGRRLLARGPETAAILLECTNLSPYCRALAKATGRPVYDLNQAIGWIAAGAS